MNISRLFDRYSWCLTCRAQTKHRSAKHLLTCTKCGTAHGAVSKPHTCSWWPAPGLNRCGHRFACRAHLPELLSYRRVMAGRLNAGPR